MLHSGVVLNIAEALLDEPLPVTFVCYSDVQLASLPAQVNLLGIRLVRGAAWQCRPVRLDSQCVGVSLHDSCSATSALEALVSARMSFSRLGEILRFCPPLRL